MINLQKLLDRTSMTALAIGKRILLLALIVSLVWFIVIINPFKVGATLEGSRQEVAVQEDERGSSLAGCANRK